MLGIKPEQLVVFERFSDSAGGYITLDPKNPQVFKTLIRAAKAKLKLRLKATVTPVEVPAEQEAAPEVAEAPAATTTQHNTTMEPVIVRSPVYQSAQRDSTAFDRRSIGSGIFQFREARASQQTLVNTDEAPVPKPFTTDTADNLVPEWAFFVRCVVDTDALRPTASRESLYDDEALAEAKTAHAEVMDRAYERAQDRHGDDDR